MTGARVFVWTAIAAAVVLVTRVVVYALVPQSLVVAELEHKTGNPHVVVAAFAGAGVAIAVAASVLWLAVVAVRERLALEGRRTAELPPPSLRRLGARALALCAISSLAFAYLESYIHWREGLGWHGIHCLIGPVHRNAIPVLVALSILAVALHAAVEHLVAWTQRLAITLAAGLPWTFPPPFSLGGAVAVLRGRPVCSEGAPRGPPGAAVTVLST